MNPRHNLRGAIRSTPGVIGNIRKSEWELSGNLYQYARPVTATEQTGNAQTGLQTQIRISGSDPIFSKAQSDGSDIRVVTAPDFTEVPHDVWTFDTSNNIAEIWAKLDYNGGESKDLYLLYGNSSVTGGSQPSNTWVFRDRFNDGSLDNWSITSGSGSVTSGYLDLDYNSNGDSMASIGIGRSDNIRAECRWYVHYDNGNGEGGPGLRHDGSGNRNAIYMGKGHGGNDRLRDGYDGNNIAEDSGVSRSTNTETWMKEGEVAVSGGYAEGRVRNSDSWISGTGAYSTTNSALNFYAWKTHVQVDWIRVREYVGSEPTTSIGSEKVA